MAAFGLLVAGAVAFGALGLGIGAQAQEGEGSPKERHAELLSQRLGISVEELKEHRQAVRDQVLDEAVAAGIISPERAERMKSGEMRLFKHGESHGMGVRIKAGVFNVFESAAQTLGMTPAELRAELMTGKSVAEVASERGVSRDALKASIVNSARAELQTALNNGDITADQRDKLQSTLEQHIDRLLDASPRNTQQFRSR